MHVYMISYNLNDKQTDYKALYRALQSYEQSFHALDATWLIRSDKTADEIFDDLRNLFDNKARLLIFEVNTDNYQGDLKEKEWDLIEEELFV